MRDKILNWFDEGFSSYEKHPDQDPEKLFKSTFDILVAYGQAPGHARNRDFWKKQFMRGWERAKENARILR